MLELLAIAEEEGWAYVRQQGHIYLVRPPYVKSALRLVDEDVVEKAVGIHGFTALRRPFGDWRELISFLNQQIVDTRKARGKELAESGLGGRLLKFAPPEVLSRFLDRIKKELLPNKEWEHAEKLLLAMLVLPTVCSDQKLLKRVADLLRKTSKARERTEEAKRSLAARDLGKVWPRIIEQYGEKVVLDYAGSFTKTHRTWRFA